MIEYINLVWAVVWLFIAVNAWCCTGYITLTLIGIDFKAISYAQGVLACILFPTTLLSCAVEKIEDFIRGL